MKTLVSFRLRKGIDDDLIEALEGIEGIKRADLCRNGLRYMLGIRTAKVMQLVEMPIEKPRHDAKAPAKPLITRQSK